MQNEAGLDRWIEACLEWPLPKGIIRAGTMAGDIAG